MRVKFLFIMALLVLSFAQVNFGQKAKPSPKPTPTKKQPQLTEKQKLELLDKIDNLIVKASEQFNGNSTEKLPTAIQGFESALKLIDSAKGQLGVVGKDKQGLIYFSIGIAYFYLNEFDKSVSILQKPIAIYLEIGDKDLLLSTIYNLLATISIKKNNHKQAVENYEKAIAAYRNDLKATQDPAELTKIKKKLGDNLINLSDELLYIGEKIKALNAAQEAYELFATLNLLFEKANSLARIGKINLALGNRKESIINYQEVLEIAKNNKTKKENPVGANYLEAISLNSLGYAFTILGEKEKGFDYYQKSLAVCETGKIEEVKPLILNNLGQYYAEAGSYSKAIETLNQSIEISRKLKDERTISITQNNIGVLYFELGNYEKAVKVWDQALEISMRLDDIETIALIVTNSANPLLESGQTDKALEFAQIARQFFEKSKDKPKMAYIFSILARISQKKGELEKSLKQFEESTNLAIQVGDKRLQSINQIIVASIHLNRQNYEQARQNFFSALRLSQENIDTNTEAYSLLGLSAVAKKQKNLPLAILYGKKAINQFQTLRGSLKSIDKETQNIFLKNIEEVYQLLADLMISQGRIAEAEQVLALLKEEEFYEYVRRDDKVAKELTAKLSLTEDEAKAFKNYNEFSENIAAIGKEYSELEAEKKKLTPNQPFTKQARLEELGKKLKDATEVFLKFLEELKVEFGEENARVAQVDSGLQAMLKEMKAHDTVIVSTIASSERLNLILTNDTIQKAYTVDITSTELNKLVADFRKAVQNPNIDPRPLGQKLYDVLVKPLTKDLADSQTKTIVWSLDGTLRYVPIAALWDGKKYLAESYANAVITLASRDKLKDIPSDKSAWKTVGFGVSKAASVEEVEAGLQVKRDFDALPSVPEELCRVVSDNESAAICAEEGIIKGRRFLDEKFTLEEFKNQLGKFPLVHIASHFSLKAGNDKNSYLLLGGGEERRLTIAELNRSNSIFVGVELLTLSACNTAMTGEKKANGVEIEGFGAIAQKQGAKSVLATLWSVADPSTRDLMNEFYTFLSVQKLSKSESLRQAQIKLIYGKYNAAEITKLRSDLAGQVSSDGNQPPFQKDEKRPFAHPFYWSPFVLIGNWQ